MQNREKDNSKNKQTILQRLKNRRIARFVAKYGNDPYFYKLAVTDRFYDQYVDDLLKLNVRFRCLPIVEQPEVRKLVKEVIRMEKNTLDGEG